MFFLTQDKVPENRTLGNLGAKLGNIIKLSGIFSQDRVGDIAGKYFRKIISVNSLWIAGNKFY